MLQVKDLCWTAPNGKQVLKNVTLDLPENRLIAISGPNGDGDQTVFRQIQGYIFQDLLSVRSSPA